MPWGFLKSIANVGASIWGTKQQNKNIDKQLAHQRLENEKNRQYNLDLAKMQNKWNREQWQMENAYNSPSAQIARMRAAGLNPDMMYGGGVSGNISASSPDMTSGAPSSPMDWSALGSKKTVADVALQTATLNQMNAQTEKIKSETEGIDIDNDFKPLEKSLGLELTKSTIARNYKEIQKISAEIPNIQAKTMNIEVDTVNKYLDAVFAKKSMQDRLDALAAQTDKSQADAEVAVRTIMSRIAMQSAQTGEAQAKQGAAEAEKLIKEFESDSQAFRLFLECVDRGIEIFDVILDFKNFKDMFKNGKFGSVTDSSGKAGK